VHKLNIIHIPCKWPGRIYSNSLHWYTPVRVSVELRLNSFYGFVLIYTRCNLFDKSYLCCSFIEQQLQNMYYICTTYVLHMYYICHVRYTNSYSIRDLNGPWELQEIKAPCISRKSVHEGGKVVSPTQRPSLPPRHIPCSKFRLGLSRLYDHSAAGRNKPVKNPSDTIGNRACHLPACPAVPRPTAPPSLRDNWTDPTHLLQLWVQLIIHSLQLSCADQSLISRLWAHEAKIRATQSEPFADGGVCVNNVSVMYTMAWNTRETQTSSLTYNWKRSIRSLMLRRRIRIIRTEFWLWNLLEMPRWKTERVMGG